MTTYDVLVAGAGPAGAATAAYFARQGFHTLMLDRHSFPRDKICGDAVTSGAMEILVGLGMKEAILKAAAEQLFYPIDSIRLLSPKGYQLDTPVNDSHKEVRTYIAPRLHFDNLVYEGALAAGAEFQQGAVQGVVRENGRAAALTVKTAEGTQTIAGRLIIGADGVTSAVARDLRQGQTFTDNHRAIALRAYLTGLDIIPGGVEFYMYDEILPGYAWIFPTAANQVNIGLGMRLDIYRGQKSKTTLNQLLDHFLSLPAIKPRLQPGYTLEGVATWQLNMGSQTNLPYAFDNALLVGDAAGFINPLTGGGIHNALISACLAGEVGTAALRANDTSAATLKRYEKLCYQQLSKDMIRSYRLQYIMLHFPFVIDWLVRRMGANSHFAQTFIAKL
ncbi:MAG: NAD(P)/FAD-dependent oxidoreductase [Chloroflexi bacterium]|nr:NAD(P)/FAD-dependent oxidoreductase [Chloroflexota bacterium]